MLVAPFAGEAIIPVIGQVGELDRIRRQLPGHAAIALTEGVRDRTAVGTTRNDTDREASATWMLLHIVRELSQHLGQLEITRDILASEGR